MEMKLREYQDQDFNELMNIVRETWQYDKFCNSKTANKLAQVFLSSCLTNYTFSQVAVLKDKVVGIILAKDIKQHKCPFKNRIKQLLTILSLYLTKEGRKVSKIFADVSQINKQLLKNCTTPYSAELSLFVVSSTCRNTGIGKVLFQSVIEYMNRQKLNNFYLFTDTSCNYGFYEHQGMIRRYEKEHNFIVNNQLTKMNFFIYDYLCNNTYKKYKS
ncbi:GNAT family N-acetyltransferase [Thomasclavelia cocleata]|mgnify:FL=1|uniref:GNAT family N-acetyltransferase n=1 Tax=Thomasclavelia cocleata TaxID=69824 RepID=UPI00242E91A0|nr:GNAT family N-acetyltransferase [Thomasclavelia cocleata]